jgi:UDP-2,4-diacetamido-2,4,6-trideoxy-beta-L-altropyranose hydrolase
MIIFRTDANEKIATGHLMRTLAIARECYRRDIPVCFVLADTKSAELMKKLCANGENYQIEVLNSRYDDPESELTAFTQFLMDEKPISVLIDSYYVTETYLTELTKHARTFYLDDIKSFDYPVDVVINYSIDAEYPSERYQEAKKYITGPTYTPLREQFRNINYEVRENISDILITTGGTDEAGMTEKIIEAALATLSESVTLNVVIGIMNRHRDHLHKLAITNKHIVIYENYSDMAKLMQKCDLAISAAGSTICELCAVGVPTICFTIADNQLPNAIGLSAKEAVIYADDMQFPKHIQKLASDYPYRRRLSANMRNLIDGYGAVRIAEELLVKIKAKGATRES